MTQEERRRFLLEFLKKENPLYEDMEFPEGEMEQRELLRALMNVRCADPISEDFLRVQDDYLQRLAETDGITDIKCLSPYCGNIYLWRGDITRLKVDAIVNAANSSLTGCYRPNHKCVDNCIHSYAGVQLRRHCALLVEKQGFEEPVGKVKVTPAFNLPSSSIFHTVGPTVTGAFRSHHEEELASCYLRCLEEAEHRGLASIAFPSIAGTSPMFPPERASIIAVETVRSFLKERKSSLRVVFVLSTKEEEDLYQTLLCP